MTTKPAAVAAPPHRLSRGKESLVHLAIAAICVGIVVVELLVIGATMPTMLRDDAGAPIHAER